jgi:hypothetical protein
VTLRTKASPTSGSPGSAFHDEALITDNGARGTLTFYLCGPKQVTKDGCPKGRGIRIGSRQTVIGDHKVFSADVKGKLTLTPGTYCWGVHYSGDKNFKPADETNHTTECFTVKATKNS